MLDVVKLEVIRAKLGDMDQTFDINRIERDKNTKAGHRRNGPIENFANPLLHEVALQPVFDIPRRFVSPSLGARALQTDVVPTANRRVLFTRKHRLDGAMHQQIGIAPNRRGEMGVMLVSQAEMADIVRAVHRLLQGTQHHGLQKLEVRTQLDLFQQHGVILGTRIVATAQSKAELTEETAQILQLFVTRRRMNAVEARLLVFSQKVRSTDIRRQHAFLDHPVSIVAHHRHNIFDLAELIEDHLGFGRLEVDRPTLGPGRVQRLEKLVKVFDVRLQRQMNLVFRLSLAGQP